MTTKLPDEIEPDGEGWWALSDGVQWRRTNGATSKEKQLVTPFSFEATYAVECDGGAGSGVELSVALRLQGDGAVRTTCSA